MAEHVVISELIELPSGERSGAAAIAKCVSSPSSGLKCVLWIVPFQLETIYICFYDESFIT